MANQSDSPKRQKAQFVGGVAPPGGFCISSFVVVSKGNNSDVLVGKMKSPEVWIERFFVGPEFAPRYMESGKYLLPASHLAWYESPVDAAARILKEQLLIDYPKEQIKLLDAQSHLRGNIEDVSNPPHWDLCFLYEVRLSPRQVRGMATPLWFDDYGFKKRSSLAADDFTRGHGDVLDEAGVIGNHGKAVRSGRKRRVAQKKGARTRRKSR